MTSPQSDRTTTRRRWALRLHTFSALRHRNYVYLWLADSFGSTANWVQQVALALLVADLTDSSAFWVGTVLGIRALPVLLIGPLAGVAIDRMDRKTLIHGDPALPLRHRFPLCLGSQRGQGERVSCIGVQLPAGRGPVGEPPGAAVPDRQRGPREDLSNAVALENSASNIIRVFAPAVGIALITPFGLAGNFFIQAGAYLAVFLMIIPMRTPYREGVAEATSVITNFMEGLRYIKTDAALLLLIVLIIIPSVLVHSTQFLLVIFADKELPGDKEVVLVILYTSMGVGALLGTLTMASLGNFQRRGLVNMGAMMAVTLLLVVFGLSPYLVLSAVIIGLLGLFNQLFRIANNSLVQARTPDVLRGRVNSIYLIDHGVQPLGIPLLALLALGVGARPAIAIGGAVALAATAFIGLRWRQLWALQ